MNTSISHTPRALLFLTLGVIATLAVLMTGLGHGSAVAATPAAPSLGTAASFAVLAGSTVTNTGPSVVNGALGVSPGSAVTGFPPGLINGALHAADAVALQAQNDVTTAYNNAAGRPSTPTVAELGGQTLVAGVYSNATALSLTGTLTLNGQGDPDSVFIFQAGSTLITGSSSTVALINGATACNVFWQIGSSATLATDSVFVGNMMALTSITAQTGASVQGRLLARNGAVTLDTNVITQPSCAVLSPTSSAATSTTATSTTATSTTATSTTATSTTPGGATGIGATGTRTPGTSAAGAGLTGPSYTVTPNAAPLPLALTGAPVATPLALGLAAIVLGFVTLMTSRRRALRSRRHR